MVTGEQTSRIARAIAVLGLVVLVIGTFLPWLKSGRARRNSYLASAAIRRLVTPPGPLDAVLSVWPLLANAAAAAIALFLLGSRRVATALAVVTAALAGTAAFWAAKSASNTYASVIDSGPRVTLLGAAMVIVAAPFSVRPTSPVPARNNTARSTP